MISSDGRPLPAAGLLGSAELRRWGGKGGAAVVEQGCFAGSHLLLNVVLARAMPPDAYGAFAFGSTVLLVIIGVFNALVLEPAAVLGMARYEPHPAAYCRTQLLLHAGFSILVGAGVAAAGLATALTGTSPQLGPTLAALGAACPFILLFWLARRFLYVLSRPGTALAGSATYLICIGTGAVLLMAVDLVTPAAAFALTAIAGAVAGTFMLAQAGVFARTPPQARHPLDRGTLLAERWHYGRWLLAVVLIEIAIVPATIFITASTLGLAAVGAMRAMQTFVQPFGHAAIALSAAALPAFARDFGQGRSDRVRQKLLLLTAVLIASALLFEVVLFAFHEELEQAVFGGKFAAVSFLIPLFGTVTLFESLGVCYATVLSAARQPQLIFRSVAMTAPLSLGVAFLAITNWGLQGALLSLTTAAMASAASKRWLAGPYLSGRREST